MLEIARNNSETGILQKDISERQDISNKYLDHIIHSLKAAGLIVNAHGKKSGYILTRPANEITIFDIHNAFEFGICVIDCLAKGVTCPRDVNCTAKGFWRKLNNQITDFFKSVSLADLTNESMVLEDVN
jgi:Rrf2 family protein